MDMCVLRLVLAKQQPRKRSRLMATTTATLESSQSLAIVQQCHYRASELAIVQACNADSSDGEDGCSFDEGYSIELDEIHSNDSSIISSSDDDATDDEATQPCDEQQQQQQQQQLATVSADAVAVVVGSAAGLAHACDSAIHRTASNSCISTVG